MALRDGTSLGDGRYVLEQHLGSGGMASVWLAADERLGRRVAVKVMSDLLAHDERWLARFKREARAAASLSHPNIVKVFDFGIDGDRPYIVMAHIPGGSLKERLAEHERALPPAPDTLARELLGALAHVHAAGILHRDVKPGNILLDDDGASHLTDFGIARPDDATQMTQTGVVLGTMKYLAPEVAAGAPASANSDLYSAGCVLREITAHANVNAPAVELDALISSLTEDDPAQRPASANEALERLRGTPHPGAAQSIDDTAPTAVLDRSTARADGPDRARERDDRSASAAVPARRMRRSPWLFPAAGLAAILLVAVLVVALASGDDPSPSGASAPAPAPASAPLDEQLRALDRMIEGAAR